MGDVIHALPVVTDILSARPDLRIDWVVEEGFADLPALHPGVGEVIPIAIRRWRRQLTRAQTWAEIGAVRARLRLNRYDLTLDLQGLLKSALVARWTGAPVLGFDRASAREPLAALAYARSFTVSRDLHAIERLRQLAGQALGYPVQGPPRFGLRAPARDLAWLPAGPYVVLLHATSRAEKLWPQDRWIALGVALAARGYSLVLPWGSEAERQAAQRLVDAIRQQMPVGTPDALSPTARSAAPSAEPSTEPSTESSTEPSTAPSTAPSTSSLPTALLAPKLVLADCAGLLANAAAVVGVDTGLTHLAAALECPTVALFAATEAWRYGPYWSARAISLGSAGNWPQVPEVLQSLDALGALA